MSKARSNFDARPLLQDDDCDITDEYDNIVEGALDMRRKFSLIVSQARRLKNELLAKQAEIDRLNTQHQQELSHHQRSATDLRKRVHAQGDRLQQNRETMRLLRRRNGQSVKDLEAARTELDQVHFLRCDICKDTIKNVVTRCGHGFCRECLNGWLQRPADPHADRAEKSCPHCRRIVIESELRDVYLGSDTRTPAVPEGDRTTEFLTADSDDE